MLEVAKTIPHNPRQNHLLAALPTLDYERLLPELELVSMPMGWTISEAGDHVAFVHFPTSGIISLIYNLENGTSSEIAMIGNEGLIGISIYMGATVYQAVQKSNAQDMLIDLVEKSCNGNLR